MVKSVRIDFTKSSEYSFSHTINNNDFKIYIRYNILFDRYFLDIDKFQDGMYKTLVKNVNITTGANILLPYRRYGIGNMYLIPNVDTEYDKLPSADTIIKKWFLFWQYDEN